MRHTWRWMSYRVECDGCDFAPPEGRNGLGLAAKHHDRTGHSVRVECFGSVQYLNDVDHAALEAARHPDALGGG